MKDIPVNLTAYKKTDTFDQDSIPKALLNELSTKPLGWGNIIILEGELLYRIPSTNEGYKLNPNKFYVEFYK